MQIPRQKPEAFPCFDYCILAPGYKINLKTQSQHCFCLLRLRRCCGLSGPFDLQVAGVRWHARKMWRGLEEGRGKSASLDVPLRRMIPSAIYPWSTVSRSGDQSVFIYEGDKETSISTQLKPVTVYSVTLRRKVNCIPSPGAHWDKSQTRCCGLRPCPSPTRAHPPLLAT